MVIYNEQHHILRPTLTFIIYYLFPPSASLILEMVAVMYNQMLQKLQHVTPLNPESRNYTLELAEKNKERKASFDVLLL
jgi:hypothetical protein